MQVVENISHPCEKCALYGESVWQPVADGAVSVLTRSFERKDLEAGQVLFEQDSTNRLATEPRHLR